MLSLEQQISVLQQQGMSDDDILKMGEPARVDAAKKAVASGIKPDPALKPKPLPEKPEAGTLSPTTTRDNVPPTGDGTKAKPVTVTSEEDLAKVRPHVAAEPTDAQKDANNYKQAHVKLHGLDIAIETPKGGMRKSRADAKEPWEVEMPADYGRIKGSLGADGEELDITIGPNPSSDKVFVIYQRNLEKDQFDEHKLFAGVDSQEEAQDLYEASFSDGKGRERMGRLHDASQPGAVAGVFCQPGPEEAVRVRRQAGPGHQGQARFPIYKERTEGRTQS